jgi:hypothetical protein
VKKIIYMAAVSQRLRNTGIYRTPILPVVFYGCKTWPLALWEEYRPKVFNNRVLEKIFGPTGTR